MNNKPADYPAQTKNLHAYLFPTYGNIKSDYGVRVSCTSKAPMICAVHVSGFYHGKLRGILGDANNEPYDDYTLPSGKVCICRVAKFLMPSSHTKLGNSWKSKRSWITRYSRAEPSIVRSLKGNGPSTLRG